MAQPSHLNSSEWRIQTMASVESAARYADQSLSNKDDPSKLPRSQDQKVEAPCWLLAKDPSHPLEKRMKWCECVPGSDCVHSSHTFISAVDGTPSVSFSTCIPVQFPVVQGVPQHHLYRSASTVDVLGDRASSACSKAGASNESSERLFLQQQPHPKGSSSEIYMGGNNQRGLGDCRSDTFRELTHYDILQNAKLKADIVSHPLYEQLLAAHVACLRVATPVEHLQTIDAQLTNTHHLAARYSMLSRNVPLVGEEKEELDHFMASYLLLLQSFKDQLQEHVRVHAMEAVVACWELEQVLANLTGVSPGEGSGATMSDDEDEDVETDYSSLDPMLVDGHDSLGFGPLIPTETERSLMERVRQELKLELKQAYRARIADVREEILRKRRAGKLPGETTSILKKWWTAHSKWPYPTEDEKARLVQETGLELKQINNWFINQRKRNWHNHPASSPSSISKSDVISNTAGQASNISLSLNSEISQRPPPSDQHLLQETSSNWASSHRLPSAGVER